MSARRARALAALVAYAPAASAARAAAPLLQFTTRTTLFCESATNSVPSSLMATPHGHQKAALVPAPSANVAAPEPASDVTTPAGVTVRMR
jgi:hypothetical protein